MAAPLTQLTKKDAFFWSDEAHKAFKKLKEVMCTCPYLAIPNFSAPFTVECDAFKL